MQLLDVSRVREVFGTLVHTAQTLETILAQTGILLTAAESQAFTAALQRIQARTLEQAALLEAIVTEHDMDRRCGERRSGLDRRQA